MLVLSRKQGEVIRIGDDISVTVLEILGSKVRIGIDAPRSISIRREEIDARNLVACKAVGEMDSRSELASVCDKSRSI